MENVKEEDDDSLDDGFRNHSDVKRDMLSSPGGSKTSSFSRNSSAGFNGSDMTTRKLKATMTLDRVDEDEY